VAMGYDDDRTIANASGGRPRAAPCSSATPGQELGEKATLLPYAYVEKGLAEILVVLKKDWIDTGV